MPLFVSRVTLSRYKTLKPATVSSWGLDSGGFTEVTKYGGWDRVPEDMYVGFVLRCSEEIGRLQFAAPQDWICEDAALRSTGLTVQEHQRRTVDNFSRLRSQLGELVIPVIQGRTVEDYVKCVRMYEVNGHYLEKERLVGVGSVCRRQATSEIAELMSALPPMNTHGFGVKKSGLKKCRGVFSSVDSLAWSFAGRRSPPLPGHTQKNCANCYEFAEQWRDSLITQTELVV